MDIQQELKSLKRTSFGVSVPEIRKLAKKIVKEDYRPLLLNPDVNFETKLLAAFTIGYIKEDIKTLLELFRSFIPFVDDWGVCDSLCQNFKIARNHRQIVWKFLEKYFKSKKEFESRIVSVMLLSHFLEDEYIEKVFEVLDNLNTDEYYAQMGVAWAIATIAGKYPERTKEYLKKDNLNKSAHNKAIAKIRESFKVDSSYKAEVNNLKR